MLSHEQAPLFITGLWRSGTTLLSRMLNNHPDCDVTYDTVHFLRFSNNRYDPISDVENAKNLISDTKQRIEARYGLQFSERDVLDDLNGQYTYASIYDAIMRNFLLKKSGKTVWGEKTNLAWSKIPEFFKLFPKGRVILIIRDPRAVLASWKKFTHAPGNDYLDSIINSFDTMQKALEYTDQFAGFRYTYITYEDLVSDPCQTMKNICEKIDIRFNELMLDCANFKDMNGQDWQSNSIHDKTLSGISGAMVDRWKAELEEWEIVLIEAVLGELLDKFRYKRSETEVKKEFLNQAIMEIQKSKLASEGLFRLLLTQEGYERYPADPTAQENWGKTKKATV